MSLQTAKYLRNCLAGLQQIRNAHHTSVDPNEAIKFAKLSNEWWNSQGPFAPLHSLNPARCKFIRESICEAFRRDQSQREPLQGLQILDVGCGGGLLAESIARMGATVHGIDLTSENVVVAKEHAAQDPVISSRISYEVVPAEDLATRGAVYDVVIASEVIEHVMSVDSFAKTLNTLLKDEGRLVISTLNRTLASYLVAIVGAEYVAGIVPKGTHDWRRFLTPKELALLADTLGLHVEQVAGMALDPLSGKWSLTSNTGVNYIALLSKVSRV